MISNWSKQEVELIVEDYIKMLHFELSGLTYSKASNRRALLLKLNNRSEGSIEFKHQNISAILIKYGFPYILGYKPRHNYQNLLEEVILNKLSNSKALLDLFMHFALDVSQETRRTKYSNLEMEPPQLNALYEGPEQYGWPPIKTTNYLKLEQENTFLGRQGEELVYNYERWRLVHAGKEKLSESVEWVSKDQGDGAGFDILSRNLNGTDRFIEVKTTKLGDKVPIYFSKNEFSFSKKNASSFYLYRVFNFYKDPKFFIKNGSFDDFCKVEPINYMGRF